MTAEQHWFNVFFNEKQFKPLKQTRDGLYKRSLIVGIYVHWKYQVEGAGWWGRWSTYRKFAKNSEARLSVCSFAGPRVSTDVSEQVKKETAKRLLSRH